MQRATILLLAAAAAAQAQWSVGTGAVDITPSEAIWLAGYASRTKPSEGVRQKIRLKALALREGAGPAAVLVTADIIAFRRPLSDRIASGIAARHGIPRERVLLNASHTHSGPMMGDPASYRFRMGDDAASKEAVIARYTEFLEKRALAAVDQAMASLAPATLHFEQGFAGFAVNRRRASNRSWPGPVDHDVPVLAVRAPGGKLRAVVFGYACHNTVLSDYLINGDYAGYAQEAVEAAHPGAVALFVLGAAADSNPLPRRTEELARRYGLTLADAVEQVLAGKMKPVAGPLRAALETAELRFQGPPSRAELIERSRSKDDVLRRNGERLLARLEKEGSIPASQPMLVQAWRFGDAITLLALAGELTVDYSHRFKRLYGYDRTWVAGYSNDVFTYVPSLRVLREGGYEGGGAALFAGLPGPFTEAVEETVAAAVEKAVASAR